MASNIIGSISGRREVKDEIMCIRYYKLPVHAFLKHFSDKYCELTGVKY